MKNEGRLLLIAVLLPIPIKINCFSLLSSNASKYIPSISTAQVKAIDCYYIYTSQYHASRNIKSQDEKALDGLSTNQRGRVFSPFNFRLTYLTTNPQAKPSLIRPETRCF